MPKRKVYDIIPPQMARKVEEVLAVMAKEEKTRKGAKKKAPAKKPAAPVLTEKRFVRKEVLIGSLIIIALLAIYAIFKLPRAYVQITPKVQEVTLAQAITADKNAAEIDYAKRIIPAYYAEYQDEKSAKFEATGSMSGDRKAQGTITIYNKLNPATPFTLIKGTHFLSNSGKYFLTLEKVTIPAAGQINVKVEAKEAGDSFNIGPSSFSVPKLSGTAYYYSIIADSKDSMRGGFTGEVKKVTAGDLQNAKDSLSDEVIAKALDSFKKEYPSDEYAIEEFAVLAVIERFEATAKEEEIKNDFQATAKTKVSVLAFKKEDLQKISENQISLQLPEYKDIVDGTLVIVHESQNPDIANGKMTMNLNLAAESYFTIDINELVGLLSNKNENEINEIIQSRHGENVAQTSVKFWPFWVKKSPNDKDRINVLTNFD